MCPRNLRFAHNDASEVTLLQEPVERRKKGREDGPSARNRFERYDLPRSGDRPRHGDRPRPAGRSDRPQGPQRFNNAEAAPARKVEGTSPRPERKQVATPKESPRLDRSTVALAPKAAVASHFVKSKASFWNRLVKKVLDALGLERAPPPRRPSHAKASQPGKSVQNEQGHRSRSGRHPSKDRKDSRN